MSWLFGEDAKEAFDRSVAATGPHTEEEVIDWEDMTDEQRAAFSELADEMNVLFVRDWTVEL